MSPLRLLRNLGRTREIVLVLLNHGFGDLVERLGLLRYLRWWNRVVLRRGEGPPSVTAPERIRLVLEELGPTFVKFGQMASTRPDLVPPGVIAQLQRLQERVVLTQIAHAPSPRWWNKPKQLRPIKSMAIKQLLKAMDYSLGVL